MLPRCLLAAALLTLLAPGCGTVMAPGDEVIDNPGTFTLALESPNLLIRAGAVATIEVQLDRDSDAQLPVAITVDGLPEGVTQAPLVIAATESSGNLVFVSELDVDQGGVPVEVSATRSGDSEPTESLDLELVLAGRPGTVDLSFADAGRLVYAPVGGIALGRGVAVQTDGGILATGSTATEALTLRVLPDGTLDPDFGTSGTALSGTGDYSEGIAVAELADGRIIVAGVANGNLPTSYDFGIHAYLPSGQLDTTFGTDGIAAFPPGSGGLAELLTLTLDSSGNLLVTGTDFGDSSLRGLKYSDTGIRDDTFNIDLALTNTDAATIQPDDKLVVAGTASSDFFVGRFDDTGSLDATFASGGSTTVDFGGFDTCHGVFLFPDGSFLLVGVSDNQPALAKLSAAGELDDTFGIGGKLVTTLSLSTRSPNGAAIDSQGRIVLVGHVDKIPAVVRLLPSGEPDHSFGLGGRAVIDFGVEGETNGTGGFGVAFDAVGRIVFSGEVGGPGGQRLIVGRLWP